VFKELMHAPLRVIELPGLKIRQRLPSVARHDHPEVFSALAKLLPMRKQIFGPASELHQGVPEKRSIRFLPKSVSLETGSEGRGESTGESLHGLCAWGVVGHGICVSGDGAP
jgi:hypothetical protein